MACRRDVQKQQTPFLLFRAFGGRSEFSKRLLSTCLITVYALKPARTSHRWDWTWFCDFELNFWKLSKNVDFSETCFSQGNGVGLKLYIDYMISKNGCGWFDWVLTYFALKMEFFWKNDKRNELCDSHDFVVFSRWNVHAYLTALICDLSVCLVEALVFDYLVLSNCLNCFKVVKGETNLVEK